VAVRGEGEDAFSAILTRFVSSRDFSGIPGIAWRDPATGQCVRNDAERPHSRDLDMYPSPYLIGLFDELLASRRDIHFQAIIETNRGCPFSCTYCFWGQGGLSKKYRLHSLERIAAEVEWFAKQRIEYIFCADSNFGIHKRDVEVARILAETKKKYGYPQKFRACFAKNVDERIYEIGMLLHGQGMEKGVTLSFQSTDEQVLQNIRRKNIKMSTYKNLQVRFNEAKVPVYSELILGLPGETYETWTTGIEQMLQSGLTEQLFVYFCQVYPNTEMADPSYQKRWGIVTKRIILSEIHGAVRPEELAPEFEDIIITTNSMPLSEWRKISVFSWVAMLLQSMRLGVFVLMYMVDRYRIKYMDLLKYISECRMPSGVGNILREEVAHFEAQLDRLLAGHCRGHEMPEFGSIYWDEEEASFLRISDKLDQFYDEMLALLRVFLKERGISYDEAELSEAVQYQRMRIHSCHPPATTERRFSFNFPEYFETRFHRNPVPLSAKPQILTLSRRDFQGDKVRYAREVILWGRKSGAMLAEVKWRDAVG
jgi:putative methyltransferase